MRSFLIYASSFSAFTLSAVPPVQAQVCGRGALALEAGLVRILPPNFGIQGTIVGSDGTVALWSAGGELLHGVAGDSIVSTGFSERMAIAGLAFGPTPGSWRVADAWTGRELLFDGDGSRLGDRPLVLSRGQLLEQGIWREEGWLLALRDAVTRRFVVVRETAGRAVPLFQGEIADSEGGISRFRMTALPEHVLLTEVRSPFRVIRVALATGQADTLLTPPLPILPDSLHLWRAQPALALDCGTLLSVASLAGDQRLLVRWDAADRLAKVTPHAVPFGLVARLPGERALLAARRAGGLELVTYRWRWSPDSLPSIPPDTRSSR
jgi:hypothetical protein